jgi:pectate lyase
LFESTGVAVTKYNVYVKGGVYSDYTKIDDQLVRNYGTYGRVDVVGLQAGDYDIKVVPVVGNDELTAAANEATGMNVRNYSREGFAFMNGYAPGAYNNDGTLKAGAKVFYVTAETAKTIMTTVTGAETNPCVGLQSIIAGYEKGKDKTPIAFRFIGLVTKDDLDAIGSSAMGLQVKGRQADSELNITLEGIGDDATLRGFGFLVRNAKGVEFRNLGIMRCMEDAISLDSDNSNIWVHHCDLFYGKMGSGDKKKGDGSVDLKDDTKYTTVSYNRYWDAGKSNMFGMKSESGPNFISYDHNWFDHSDSRHPRVRTMSVHVWNNYFDNVAKYGVGATSGSSVFVENNYFLKTKKPILSSQQGTDGLGSGTFSGENGGMIKAYGNYFDRSAPHFSYYTQKNPSSKGYDAYETATRDEQVPVTEKTLAGGTTYDNFDTAETVMYSYTAVAAEDVPALVTGFYGAGRMNHGDFQYTFPDNIGNDDTDSAYDTTLGGLLDSYKSGFVGFFGDDNETGEETGDEPGGDEPGGDEPGGEVTPDNGTILCTFDKSGTPSSSLFTVIGNGSDSKGTVVVDGQEITTCLKMETSTSVKFTLTESMKMTLYFGPEETASIKIDGTKIQGSGNTYTTTLQAGSHELTKDKSVNLFAIKLEPLE